jgi:formamidopyrimidine-DNA glycosylase
MIELPEAVAIAAQLDQTIRGKRIVESNTGNSPHKWVFYKPSRGKLEKILLKKNIGEVTSVGRGIHIGLELDQALVIDEFGGKLLYHDPGTMLPQSYHLFLKFEDDSFFTVAIQGWGFISTLREWEQTKWTRLRANSISPADASFTVKRFLDLFEQYEDKEKDSIKTFFTNGESVAGIGNAYLQDILFRARLSPKRKVADISSDEKKALYGAAKDTIKQAIEQNGRTSEKDIFDNPGRYSPIMDRQAKDKPCPNCGTLIQKINYLGGSCYICPSCQR